MLDYIIILPLGILRMSISICRQIRFASVEVLIDQKEIQIQSL